MKNQGLWITKIIMLAVCVFVVLYMGYHIIKAAEGSETAKGSETVRGSVRTETVGPLRGTDDTIRFTGLVLRDETAVDLPGGMLALTVSEGERVAKDQKIAVTYAAPGAMEANEKIRELEARLEQLKSIEGNQAQYTDVEKAIYSGLVGVMDAAGKGDASGAFEYGMEFRTALFHREHLLGADIDLGEMKSKIEDEITVLRGSVSGVTGYINAPEAGLFSGGYDGFGTGLSRSFRFEDFECTLEELETYINADYSFMDGKGKIIRGNSYKIVLALPEATARSLGSSALINFAGDERRMDVSSVKHNRDKDSIVTLSSNELLSRMTTQRTLTGDIILARNKGVSIPKKAVVYEDDKTYVYCVVLSRLVRKPVEIMPEVDREDYYLVKYDPATDKNGIRPGDEVVVAGKNLYDGKVIE